MNEIQLTRKQIAKLIEMYTHFPEVSHFNLSVDRSSGIGAGIQVSFDLTDCVDAKIDITDVAEW